MIRRTTMTSRTKSTLRERSLPGKHKDNTISLYLQVGFWELPGLTCVTIMRR